MGFLRTHWNTLWGGTDYKRCFTHAFFAVLAVKIILSFLFASDFLVDGFAPFVDYFVSSGFQNPYTHFLSIGEVAAFPYSSVMLWLLAIPRALLFFLFEGEGIGFLHSFVTRIPVLLADVLIYLVLCRWLETKEKEVLLLYFASPILIYINYFHGQLDVIPTALLFASLVFMFRNKYFWSFLLLGVGLATKSHLIAALPLYFVYLYVNKKPVPRILGLCAVSIATYFILISPYAFSEGYSEIVLRSSEQGKLFLLNFPYSFGDTAFLIAPGAYLLLFFRFASYKKINQDMFILILGLVFSVLVTLVIPQSGWFYWSIPFLAYFYIKRPEAPTINLWLLNAFYILYFLFKPESDVLESFQLVSTRIAESPNLYDHVAAMGTNPDLFSNLFFTTLIASMAMNVLWCYKAGIKSNFEYRTKDKPVLIGVGGDSGAGKSTFGESLEKLFGKKQTVCVNGDDVHKWPRGHENWEVFTHLNPKSNHLHTELEHAIALKGGGKIERVMYDHSTGKFTDPVDMESNKFILFIGLHTYYIKKMRDIFDIKIFIDPDESLRTHWKIVRDMEYRGYSKEKVLKQLEKRDADSKKYIKPQRDKADVVFSYLPQEEIKDIGNKDEDVRIKLRIYCDNSVYIDPFIDILEKESKLSIDYWHEGDLDTQCLELTGQIDSSTLNEIAHDLVPNMHELIQNDSVEWEEDYKGLSQLFALYYLSEISKYQK